MRPVAGIVAMLVAIALLGVALRLLASGGGWRGAGIALVVGAVALFSYAAVLTRR